MEVRRPGTLNGIDLNLLGHYVDGMCGSAPYRATGHVRHEWTNAFSGHGSFEAIEENGERLERSHHTYHTDRPAPFSADTGPTPGLESVLAAVAACAATSFALKATMEGVAVRSIEVSAEGTLDLKGLFGFGTSDRAGVNGIRIHLTVDADADDGTLEALLSSVWTSSPVIDALVNPVDIDIALSRAIPAPAASASDG
jgi:putative redox protein